MRNHSYLVLALAALSATACGAQSRDTSRAPALSPAEGERDGRGPEGRPRDGRARRDPLLRGIELTAAQRERVEAIDAKLRRERDAARQAGADQDDRAARHERMSAAMDRRATEVRALLTPAQQEQFDRNREEMRARMREHGPDAPRRRGEREAEAPRGA